jgi:hypothetical protein
MDAKMTHAKMRRQYILRVNRQEEKEKQKTPSDDPMSQFLHALDEWKRQSSRRK